MSESGDEQHEADRDSRRKKHERQKNPSSVTIREQNNGNHQSSHRNASAAADVHGLDDSDDEDDTYLVSCRCESAKAVSTLLSCLKRIAVGADAERESVLNRSGNGGRSGSGNSRRASLNASTLTANTNTSTATRYRRRTIGSTLQPVTVYCSPTGLTFHVYGKSKQMQASVDIQSQLFSDYSVSVNSDEESTTAAAAAGGEFCVNLTTLMDCLHSLGTHTLDKTKLCFSYNVTKEVFKMELLEESGVLSTAAIPGMVPPNDTDDHESSLALAFRSSPILARMIVQSHVLQDLVSELELVAGGTMATVLLAPNAGLQMSVVGFLGECRIVLPVRGSHIVSVEFPASSSNGNANGHRRNRETTATAATTTARTYPLRALTESMRGLEIAKETCLTINAAGMLAIQHQVFDRTLSDNTPSFIDFILCCMQDDMDDADDVESTVVQATVAGAATSAVAVATRIRRGRHPKASLAWSQSIHGDEDDGETTVSQSSSPATAASTTTAAAAAARIVSQNKVYYESSDDREEANETNDIGDDDDAALTNIHDETATTTTSASNNPVTTRLFGTIVAEADTQSVSTSFLDTAVASRKNSRKRRFGRTSAKSGSDAAPTRTTRRKGRDDTDDEAAEDDVLDITATTAAAAPAPPVRRRKRRHEKKDGHGSRNGHGRDEDSPPSSPELVYGSQE